MAEGLVLALEATLSPVEEERASAEALLDQQITLQGHTHALMQIMMSESTSASTRQAAAIRLKNIVRTRWALVEQRSSFHVVEVQCEKVMSLLEEEDKEAVRQSIIAALATTNHLLRPQIIEMLRHIVDFDFPDRLPHLVPMISCGLDVAQPLPVILASVTALRVLLTNLRYAPSSQRQTVDLIISSTFPLLVPLMAATLASPGDESDAANVQKQVLKCFRAAIVVDLPPLFLDEQFLMGWVNFLFQILSRPAPASALPSPPSCDDSSVSKQPFWKCFRNASILMHRLVTKYSANKPKADGTALGSIARVLREMVAPQFLQLILGLLSQRSQGGYLPEKVNYELMNFVRACVPIKATWLLLKPHANTLIDGHLRQHLGFTARDEQQWVEDPQEYIRASTDVLEELASQRHSASDLIRELCWKRAATCLVPTFEMCERVCLAYREGRCPRQEKDGALTCVGLIASLLGQAGGSAQLLRFAREHVMPEFQSSAGHLRSRACWVIGTLAGMLSEDAALLNEAMACVVALLRDGELPVSFQAALCIRSLIFDESSLRPRPLAAQAVQHILPNVLDDMFRLMDVIGSDELMACLEKLIQTFASSMEPFAEGMARRISDHLVRLVTSSRESEGISDEEEFEAIFAASQCLSALVSLTRALRESPEMHALMQSILIPLLLRMLPGGRGGEGGDEEDTSLMGQELAEDVLELSKALTDTPHPLSEAVLSILPPIVQLGMIPEEESICALNNCCPTIRNIIRNATSHLVKNPGCIAGIQQLSDSILSQALDADEGDFQDACLLSQDLMICCRGACNAGLPTVLCHIEAMAMDEDVTDPCKRELLKLFGACLYCDAAGCVNFLESKGCLIPLINTMISNLEMTPSGVKVSVFESVRDQKMCAVALLAASSLSPSVMPKSLQACLGSMVGASVGLLSSIQRLRAEGVKAETSNDNHEKNLVAFKTAPSSSGGVAVGNMLSGEIGDDMEQVDQGEDFEALLNRMSEAREQEGDAVWNEFLEVKEGENWNEDGSCACDAIDEHALFRQIFTSLQEGGAHEDALIQTGLAREISTMIPTILSYQAPVRRLAQRSLQAELQASRVREMEVVACFSADGVRRF